MVSCGLWLIHLRSINLGSGGQYPNHLDGYGYSEAAGFKHRLTLRAVMNQLSESLCDPFVISIFQCFVAGIHSCWASPQAKVISAENQALVIVASHCILTSELERFCETNLAHGSAKLVEHIFVKRPYLGKRGKCCAKASAKAVHLVPIYLTILGESTKTDPLLLSSVRQGISPAVSQLTSRNPL